MGANGIDSMTSNEEVDARELRQSRKKSFKNLKGANNYALAA